MLFQPVSALMLKQRDEETGSGPNAKMGALWCDDSSISSSCSCSITKGAAALSLEHLCGAARGAYNYN
jgi:hypothetical protein